MISKKNKIIISVIIAVTTILLFISALCINSLLFPEPTEVKPENFRVTAYMVDYSVNENMDFSHFDVVTDFILFGCATFNEDGDVVLNDNIEEKVNILKNEIEKYDNKNLYLSILGPGNQSSSSDWYEQMDDMAKRHTNAFESGNLENNIKSVLEKYNFDGIFFDYEYPIKKRHWIAFDKFILSLDEVLTDSYKIGITVAAWDLGQSRKAQKVTDFIAVMSYDLWDENGNHATIEQAKDDIAACRKAGYDMAKLDLGLPFYARPTTRDAYWYDYKSYSGNIDKNGLYIDKGNTELIFSFNTPDIIKKKTEYAIANNLGGVMIWHYDCDTVSGSGNSLFDAIETAKNEATVK